jgi:hypothetical protein
MKHSNHLCYTSRRSPLRLTTKLCHHCRQHIDAAATRCQHCTADLRIWWARHPILTTLLVFFFFFLLLVIDGRFRTARARRAYSWLHSCDASCAADLGPNLLHYIDVSNCRELGGILESNAEDLAAIGKFREPSFREHWLRVTKDKAESLKCP